MFIDTEVFRRQVRGLRQISLDLRDRALTTGTAAGADWVSTAADRYRADLATAGAELRTLADEVDQAASDLEHHADEVDATKAAIRAAQDWVDDQVHAAHRLLATAADAVADTVTGAYETATGAVERSRDVISLVFASAPEAGSIGWLQLRAQIEHR
ncbi:hypothetical protein [Pengzhenrongella phosphoraccumulans]|uniref:hypothetical protein n=1 Tax=Pengzhenrongella phosphoraccumulans TaxID=3114394 RepID=UPI00389034C9